MRKLTRRFFLKSVALIGGTGITAFNLKAQNPPNKTIPLPSPTSSPQGLTFNASGYDIWIRKENEIIACYRAHPSQKYPYIYPLTGPISGIPLTTETALPWYHHRSIFFGCDRVNGDDYWSQELNKGKIISSQPKVVEISKNSIQINDNCEWRSPKNEVVMSDERKINLILHSDTIIFLDWEIVWKAVADVTIQKTNHSLFSIRSAPDITPSEGGNLVNANGNKGEKETFGKKSAWCAFYGKRKRTNIIEGIALFDHPKNLWSPTEWFTRDYGFISPTPFNFIEKPINLKKDTLIALKYRVVGFGGTPEEAQLNKLFSDWSKA